MLFSYDTELMLTFTCELINTHTAASDSGADELSTVAQLAALLDSNEYTGRRDHDVAELQAIRGLRDELRTFWSMDRDSAAELVNAMLREELALPQLARHGTADWHLHASEPDASLLSRMRVEAAMAFLDVVRSDELDRLGVCAADDCDAVLVDLSKNRSKRYCDVGNCGNRMNVIAYRARQARARRS